VTPPARGPQDNLHRLDGQCRIDKWLWYARLIKTRSLAGKLIEAGAVTLRGLPVAKSSEMVRVGDVVVLQHGPRRRSVTVSALGERRGPAAEARQLYAEIADERISAQDWVPLVGDED
jgi:ribosome-associated heat shock protein Hsp15